MHFRILTSFSTGTGRLPKHGSAPGVGEKCKVFEIARLSGAVAGAAVVGRVGRAGAGAVAVADADVVGARLVVGDRVVPGEDAVPCGALPAVVPSMDPLLTATVGVLVAGALLF